MNALDGVVAVLGNLLTHHVVVSPALPDLLALQLLTLSVLALQPLIQFALQLRTRVLVALPVVILLLLTKLERYYKFYFNILSPLP